MLERDFSRSFEDKTKSFLMCAQAYIQSSTRYRGSLRYHHGETKRLRQVIKNPAFRRQRFLNSSHEYDGGVKGKERNEGKGKDKQFSEKRLPIKNGKASTREKSLTGLNKKEKATKTQV